jgi:F-type H+-transporting ATPase subunit delta
VTVRAAARRYARALFDVALAEADPERVAGELDAFAALVQGHDELWRVLTRPGVPPARKRAVVAALLARGEPVTPALAKLLDLLAERDRVTLLPALVGAYRDRLLEHRRVVRAEVATAVPIDEDRRRALADGLARATGREVLVEWRVDPALIGGAVARIGSVVMDGSVARQLERAKAALATPVEARS